MSTIEPRTFPLKGGGTVVIRSAEESDAEALLANLEENLEGSYNATAPGENVPTVEKERAWIRDHRERPGWLAVVAEVEGRVVGLLNFRNGSQSRRAHRGSFGMSVLEAWRGRGIGDALLTTLLDWARGEAGIVKVCLAVFAENRPALGLYEKHGFVVEGRRPREIRLEDGTYADDLLMYRFVDV